MPPIWILSDEFSLDKEIPQSEQKWANYVRGVVKFIQERCPDFKQGADLVISGNVPHSSGLSSSAALEVATGKFCQQLGDLPLSHTEIALIGQKSGKQICWRQLWQYGSADFCARTTRSFIDD